jgi:riboflavin kinase / FMN adenylyltransferase
VKEAAEFLGGPFLFEGEVVEGDRRGRTLGMPTANLVPDDAYVHPGHGVYAAEAKVMPSPASHASARTRPSRVPAAGHEPSASGIAAAVNVGVRPTFETGRGLVVEAHLIDFDGDLYGETLRIAFVERLRGEKRFDSVDELVAQMNRDVEEARAIASRT